MPFRVQLGLWKPQNACNVPLEHIPAESPSLSRGKMLPTLGKPTGSQPGGMSVREEQLVGGDAQSHFFKSKELRPSCAGCWLHPPL